MAHNCGASRSAHPVVVCPLGGADRKLSPSQRRIVLAMAAGDASIRPKVVDLLVLWRLGLLVFIGDHLELVPDVVVGSGGFIGRVVPFQWETTNHQRPYFPSATASALTPR